MKTKIQQVDRNVSNRAFDKTRDSINDQTWHKSKSLLVWKIYHRVPNQTIKIIGEQLLTILEN